jgi:hypothetical protein
MEEQLILFLKAVTSMPPPGIKCGQIQSGEHTFIITATYANKISAIA